MSPTARARAYEAVGRLSVAGSALPHRHRRRELMAALRGPGRRYGAGPCVPREHGDLDADEPVELAGFWATVFGADEPDVVYPFCAIVDNPGGPNLMFIKVPESKSAKNRMLFDLHAPDADVVDAEAERLVRAGASLIARTRCSASTGDAPRPRGQRVLRRHPAAGPQPRRV